MTKSKISIVTPTFNEEQNIEKISKYLDFDPTIKFRDGLELVYKWYNQNSI